MLTIASTTSCIRRWQKIVRPKCFDGWLYIFNATCPVPHVNAGIGDSQWYSNWWSNDSTGLMSIFTKVPIMMLCHGFDLATRRCFKWGPSVLDKREYYQKSLTSKACSSKPTHSLIMILSRLYCDLQLELTWSGFAQVCFLISMSIIRSLKSRKLSANFKLKVLERGRGAGPVKNII